MFKHIFLVFLGGIKIFNKKNLFLEDYNGICDEIKLMSYSSIRLKILTILLQSNYKMNEIRHLSKLSYSSISRNISILENKKFVVKKENGYHLTNLGKIRLINLLNFNDSFLTLKEYSNLWLNHNIDSLGMFAMLNISLLKNSKLIKSSKIDINKAQNELLLNISNSKFLNFMFTDLNPKYLIVISKLLEKQVPVNLIVSKEISKGLIFNLNQKLLKKGFKDKFFKIFTPETDIKMDLFLNDKSCGFSLFLDEKSDKNRLLLSNDKDALIWSKKIFESYLTAKNGFVMYYEMEA